MSTEDTKRINIVLPTRTYNRIERLRKLTSTSTVTDVIKNAILTHEALAEFLSDGYKFYVKRDGDPHYSPVNFIFDVEPKAAPTAHEPDRTQAKKTHVMAAE
jgi:hypothetical protein